MDDLHISTEVLDQLSSLEAWEYRIVPYKLKGKVLTCYGEKGRDYHAVVEELETLTGKSVIVNPVGTEDFLRLINRCYRKGRKANIESKSSASGTSGFFYVLIDDALRNDASDIHFEPYKETCRVRFRIDGQLIERHMIEKGIYASLVNQIKILANLDISEKRLPQDGRILYHCGQEHFDVRV